MRLSSSLSPHDLQRLDVGYGRNTGTKSYSKVFAFCVLLSPGNHKNGLTFGWDSVRKRLIRVSPRENGRKVMASARRQLFQEVLL